MLFTNFFITTIRAAYHQDCCNNAMISSERHNIPIKLSHKPKKANKLLIDVG